MSKYVFVIKATLTRTTIYIRLISKVFYFHSNFKSDGINLWKLLDSNSRLILSKLINETNNYQELFVLGYRPNKIFRKKNNVTVVSPNLSPYPNRTVPYRIVFVNREFGPDLNHNRTEKSTVFRFIYFWRIVPYFNSNR